LALPSSDTTDKVQLLPLDEVRVQKHNVRTRDIDDGIDDLATSIRALGLLQPITAYYDSENSRYVVLAGQRRLNAHSILHESYPTEGFDKIKAIVIPEPSNAEDKTALSLAENVTHLGMHQTDLIKAVTDLYNVYHDYDMVQVKFGLSKFMINKYVKLARLPVKIIDAINDGQISSNPQTAENAALRAVDALRCTSTDSDEKIENVLKLARNYASGEFQNEDLDDEAKKGGNPDDIAERARSKIKKKFTVNLSLEVAEKLQRVSADKGEKEISTATSFIVQGVTDAYKALD
jgi:ParB/RepB/Spo0J family partition protein